MCVHIEYGTLYIYIYIYIYIVSMCGSTGYVLTSSEPGTDASHNPRRCSWCAGRCETRHLLFSKQPALRKTKTKKKYR